MKKRHHNVGIVTFPICETGEPTEDTKAGNIPFSNLVDILRRLFDNLYVITGNKQRVLFKKDDTTHILEVRHETGANSISRIINYTITQLKFSLKLARLSGKVSLWIFFIGAEGLMLPMLTAKLLRRRVALALTGFPSKLTKEEQETLYKMVDLQTKINLVLSDMVIAYSERIVSEYDLGKHRNKIAIAQEHFLDFNKFKVQRPLSQRDNLVAYIGRLSEAKGVPNFMEAFGTVLTDTGSISFLIGGDGPFRDRVKEYLDTANLNSKAEFAGWIPHDELPNYLNNVKLLVLPSYTEALPNIILEAMACGTPVLATAVGAIPDIIKDGETGFIMENNSPDCIAANIIRALKHPNLGEIAVKARSHVESAYTYETAVERYSRILDILTG